MRIKTLVTIQLGRVQRPAGSILELEDDAAQRLIAGGHAEATEASFPDVPAVAPPLTEAQEYFRNLNAADAIAHLATVETLDELKSLAVVEKARAKGARKTVVDAFEARAAELDRVASDPATETDA